MKHTRSNKFVRYLIGLFCVFVSMIRLDAEVIELPPYNWGENIMDAPTQSSTPGRQILHFGSTDYPYQDCPETVEFVDQYLKKAKALTSDADLLRYASDQVTLQGAYIELGVTTGKTINFIAALNPGKTIFGIDSFLGSPEDYVKEGHLYKKGTFGVKDMSLKPAVLSNVKLIQGDFTEALPYLVTKMLGEKGQVAFLHVDCDLYSSTHTALEILGPFIKPGTIIVFDDFYGYPEYKEFEFLALNEFLEKWEYAADYFAFNSMFEGVAVRICINPSTYEEVK